MQQLKPLVPIQGGVSVFSRYLHESRFGFHSRTLVNLLRELILLTKLKKGQKRDNFCLKLSIVEIITWHDVYYL